MDLEYLERQIVARFHYESAFHALREYDDEKVVIAYARKILGLDQHDDRSESPQIEADIEPPPIGTPLGKAQEIRLIKSNPRSNALKTKKGSSRQKVRIRYRKTHGWVAIRKCCLQVPCQRTPKKTGRWLACHPQPIACSRSALTPGLPPRLRTRWALDCPDQGSCSPLPY
jgi:hypothetical protein